MDIICEEKTSISNKGGEMSYLEQGTKDYEEVVTFEPVSRVVSSSNIIISSLSLETKNNSREI